MKYIEKINNFISTHQLLTLVIVGFLFRLLAVFFAKGYGMHDDHFLVIEVAQSWVDNYDYNKWLPSSGISEPSGHNFFYPGIHYLLFLSLKYVGITDPQTKMFIVRLLHALWSLLIIFFGYKITYKLSNNNKKIAFQTGFLLSLLFFMPCYLLEIW